MKHWLNRKYNQIYAFILGYFWLRCPICNEYFGGHEGTNEPRLYIGEGLSKLVCSNEYVVKRSDILGKKKKKSLKGV